MDQAAGALRTLCCVRVFAIGFCYDARARGVVVVKRKKPFSFSAIFRNSSLSRMITQNQKLHGGTAGPTVRTLALRFRPFFHGLAGIVPAESGSVPADKEHGGPTRRKSYGAFPVITGFTEVNPVSSMGPGGFL